MTPPAASASARTFWAKVERGNDRVLWGKLFQVLDGLGIRVTVDTPASIIQSDVERVSDGGSMNGRQQK